MGDVEQGGFTRASNPIEQFQNPQAVPVVQPVAVFVHDQYVGILDHRAKDQDGPLVVIG